MFRVLRLNIDHVVYVHMSIKRSIDLGMLCLCLEITIWKISMNFWELL